MALQLRPCPATAQLPFPYVQTTSIIRGIIVVIYMWTSTFVKFGKFI